MTHKSGTDEALDIHYLYVAREQTQISRGRFLWEPSLFTSFRFLTLLSWIYGQFEDFFFIIIYVLQLWCFYVFLPWWGNIGSSSGLISSVKTGNWWRQSSRRLQRWWGACSISLMRKICGIQDCSAWRRLGGDLINARKYLKGMSQVNEARLFSVVPSDRIRSKWHKLKHGKFHTNMRKTSLLWGDSTGTGCPEKWWSLLLWRYSRPTWTLSCVTYSKGSALTRVWTMWSPEVTSKPYYSLILLFCNIDHCC